MWVGQTVPQDQLAPAGGKGGKIGISRVVEKMTFGGFIERRFCKLQIGKGVIGGRVFLLCQVFESARRNHRTHDPIFAGAWNIYALPCRLGTGQWSAQDQLVALVVMGPRIEVFRRLHLFRGQAA